MTNIDFRQIVHALSDMLDLVGIDDVQHGKRVAFMAVECGRYMGMNDAMLDTIYHAALIHDCGVSSSNMHTYLVTELNWDKSEDHCLCGEALLSGHHLFADYAPIILYHHTHWDILKDKNLPDDIKLIANCIYMADRIDALVVRNSGKNLLLSRDIIRNTIRKYKSTFFSPELVDIFLNISQNEIFWLMLDPRHISTYICDMSKVSKVIEINEGAFLEIAKLFASVVDAKSTFTAEHSFGVAKLSKLIGKLAGLDNEVCSILEISGLLHDLGKLNVPDEILDKPARLTIDERAVMMHHSFESYQILKRIDGFETIAKLAAFHHETLSGQGYPFHLEDAGLPLEARIIAIADIFQALAQNRPYRLSMPPWDIMGILTRMTEENKLDAEIVSLVNNNLQGCWEAATGK
ncbi:MAG: HD domain-containing protein [Desulfobacterales bacterium]|nr:HD domain-containing protein [Desulfobacterales bacterium]